MGDLSDEQYRMMRLQIEKMPGSKVAEEIESLAQKWQDALPEGKLTEGDLELVKVQDKNIEAAHRVADRVRPLQPKP